MDRSKTLGQAKTLLDDDVEWRFVGDFLHFFQGPPDRCIIIMVSRLSKAFRGASFRKYNRMKSCRDCDQRSVNEPHLCRLRQIDAIPIDTDPLDEVVYDPSISGNIGTDSDSDLDSLSDILGGPYQPSNRNDKSIPISQQEERSQITGITPQNHMHQHIDKQKRDFDIHVDDKSITEEELRSFVDQCGDDFTTDSMSQRSSKPWKRQLNQLIYPKRLSGESKTKRSVVIRESDDDEAEGDGELLEYGGNAVVIHCETQEITQHRPESSEEQEKHIGSFFPDARKVKPPSRLDRWKEVASTWRRAVNLGKFLPRKISRFDDLSTGSSSDSETDDLDFYTDDESDGFTVEFLQEAEVVPVDLLFPCGCGVTYYKDF